MIRGTVGSGLLTVLLFSTLTAAVAVPSMVSYVFISAVYLLVLGVCFLRGELAIRTDRLILYPVVAIWVVFVVAFALRPSVMTGIRTAAFVVFAAVNLFVIPATFSRDQFLDAVAVVATATVVAAIPVAIPAIESGTAGFGVWQWNDGIPVLMSVFTNPNHLAALSAFGLVAQFGVARTPRRKRWAVVGGAVCLFGLLASQGRAALLGVVGAVVLVGAYRLSGRRAVAALTGLGIVGGIVFFAFAFVDISDIGVASSVYNNRVPLWTATVQAIQDRPLIGWGLGDDAQVIRQYGGSSLETGTHGTHNSYLRMFLDGGMLGGTLYLVICAGALKRAFEALGEDISVTATGFVLLPLLALVLTMELFSGSTIFGLSPESTIPALVFGFATSGRSAHATNITKTSLRASIQRENATKDSP